jgi:hypothetical protein
MWCFILTTNTKFYPNPFGNKDGHFQFLSLPAKNDNSTLYFRLLFPFSVISVCGTVVCSVSRGHSASITISDGTSLPVYVSQSVSQRQSASAGVGSR